MILDVDETLFLNPSCHVIVFQGADHVMDDDGAALNDLELPEDEVTTAMM